MTARNALWTNGGTTSAEEDRALIASCFPVSGVVSPTDLAVTQRGTPNMSVDVAAGRVVVAGTENALQGRYVGWLDASLNVVIAASDPTNARIDLIVAKFQDAQYSGVTNAFSVVAVTGTPSGSPVAPAAPNNSIILAQIAVAANATTIVTGNITDKRVGTGDSLPVATSTLLYPTAPFAGFGVYRRTNDANEGVEFWNTAAAAYRKSWNMPWGRIGSASITATSANFTANADIASLAVTFTAVANRLYVARFDGMVQSTISGDRIRITVTDGTTTYRAMDADIPQATGRVTLAFEADVAGLSAGSKTIKCQGQRVSGTGNCNVLASATQYAGIVIEDVGPNGAPS